MQKPAVETVGGTCACRKPGQHGIQAFSFHKKTVCITFQIFFLKVDRKQFYDQRYRRNSVMNCLVGT